MLQSFDLKKEGYTNQVLFQKRVTDGFTNEIYALPAYFQVNVVGVTEINLQNSLAQIEVVIKIRILYGKMPRRLVNLFKRQLVLETSQQKQIKLNPQNNWDIEFQQITDNQGSQNHLIYTIHTSLYSLVLGQVFWSPFEKFYLVNSLRLIKWQTDFKNQQGRTIVLFNFMDFDEMQNFTKRINNRAIVDFGDQTITGFYQIAPNQIHIQFSNQRVPLSLAKHMRLIEGVKKKMMALRKRFKKDHLHNAYQMMSEAVETSFIRKKQYLIEPFNYTHIGITLFRHPTQSIITILIPLIMLGVLNLSIYFAETDQNKRLNIIATMMVSFVALIPAIRNMIPPTEQFTFIEILVFTELIGTLLTVAQTLLYRNQQKTTDFDGFFIANTIIVIISVLAVAALLLFFYCVAKPKFLKIEPSKKAKAVHFKNWSNRHCDNYFKNYLKKFTFDQNKFKGFTQKQLIKHIITQPW